MQKILRRVMVALLAALFVLPLFSQSALAYHYNYQPYDRYDYRPIHSSYSYQYSYSYGWDGWNWNRVNYRYTNPYVYSPYRYGYSPYGRVYAYPIFPHVRCYGWCY